MSEQRRGARIASDFWVTVEGVDDGPVLRSGDLSVSGICFRSDRHVGEVGSVQWLHVASLDRSVFVDVIARVIRVVAIQDSAGAATTAVVALEFMPEHVEISRALERLVRAVASSRPADETVEHRFDAQVERTGGGGRAQVRRIGLQRAVLQTTWPLAPGELVRVAIDTPLAEGVCFEGKAGNVTPRQEADGRTTFLVDVKIVRDQEETSVTSVAGLIRPPHELDDVLLRLLVPPPERNPPSRKEHLTGLLARIRLPSLLTLFELERLSGELRLARAGATARLWLRDGRPVDVEAGVRGEAPTAALGRLVEWSDGEFEFTVGEVARPERFGGLGVTALLLDLAREKDEGAGADRDFPDGDSI